MKRLVVSLCLLASFAFGAAPTPYPLEVNSQSLTLPAIEMYRASQRTIRITYKDGASASDITGHTPWMSWATNETATTMVTSSVSIVTATSGVADATFSAADLNYAPGRYVYHVGLTTNGISTVYRHGVMIIRGSPFTVGVDPTTFTSNINWNLFVYSATATGGPYRAGNNITFSSNADGSVNINGSAGASDTHFTNSLYADYPITITGTADGGSNRFGLTANGTITSATFNATSGYQKGGTNLILWYSGSIGGTNSAYFETAGSNFHLRRP